MKTKIAKWGNSLGIRIPREIGQALHVADGSAVEVYAKAGTIVVKPIKSKRRRYKLEDLVRRINDGNRHGEFWQDGPTGRELI